LFYTKDTPFGNISVTATADQLNFYNNNSLLFSTANLPSEEEAVHYPMLQHPFPESVLIVSGGIAGMAVQVGKYENINCFDYCEINPWMIKAEEKLTEIPDLQFLHIIAKDARSWIGNSGKRYDVIIVNSPDPENAQINRYFTAEFFTSVKKALHSNGIFSISLSSTANYMDETSREVNGILYNTLGCVFNNVKIIPGERNYFIASDSAIRVDIALLTETRGIENEYVNKYYIDDDLLQHRVSVLLNSVRTEGIVINSDLIPRAYFAQIRNWLNISDEKMWIVIAILMLLILPGTGKINAVSAGIFTSGFTGAAMEFLIIITFQICYGYIYQMLGIIIGIYMAGLSIGSLVNTNFIKTKKVYSFIFLQVLLLTLVLLFPALPVIIQESISGKPWAGKSLLMLITFVIAIVSGLVFNIAGKLEPCPVSEHAGVMYAIDLSGAATGILLVSLIIFPLAGLRFTSLFLSVILLAGILTLLVRIRKYTG